MSQRHQSAAAGMAASEGRNGNKSNKISKSQQAMLNLQKKQLQDLQPSQLQNQPPARPTPATGTAAALAVSGVSKSSASIIQQGINDKPSLPITIATLTDQAPAAVTKTTAKGNIKPSNSSISTALTASAGTPTIEPTTNPEGMLEDNDVDGGTRGVIADIVKSRQGKKGPIMIPKPTISHFSKKASSSGDIVDETRETSGSGKGTDLVRDDQSADSDNDSKTRQEIEAQFDTILNALRSSASQEAVTSVLLAGPSTSNGGQSNDILAGLGMEPEPESSLPNRQALGEVGSEVYLAAGRGGGGGEPARGQGGLGGPGSIASSILNSSLPGLAYNFGAAPSSPTATTPPPMTVINNGVTGSFAATPATPSQPMATTVATTTTPKKAMRVLSQLDVNELIQMKISQLESASTTEDEDEKAIAKAMKKIHKELMQSVNGEEDHLSKINLMQRKYLEMFQEARKQEREQVKMKKKFELLQREKELLQREKDRVQKHNDYLVATQEGIEKEDALSRAKEAKSAILVKMLEQFSRDQFKETKMVQSRSDKLATYFEKAIVEFTTTVEDEIIQRQKKVLENEALMQEKFTQFTEQYDLREKHFNSLIKAKDLELQLGQAKVEQQKQIAQQEMAKVDLLKSQLNAFSKTEAELRKQLNVYVDKFKQVEETLNKSNSLFQTFRKEMEAMSTKGNNLEKVNLAIRAKCDTMNRNILEMAEERTNHQKALDEANRKRIKLESLCRALQSERSTLRKNLELYQTKYPTLKGLSTSVTTTGQTASLGQTSTTTTGSPAATTATNKTPVSGTTNASSGLNSTAVAATKAAAAATNGRSSSGENVLRPSDSHTLSRGAAVAGIAPKKKDGIARTLLKNVINATGGGKSNSNNTDKNASNSERLPPLTAISPATAAATKPASKDNTNINTTNNTSNIQTNQVCDTQNDGQAIVINSHSNNHNNHNNAYNRSLLDVMFSHKSDANMGKKSGVITKSELTRTSKVVRKKAEEPSYPKESTKAHFALDEVSDEDDGDDEDDFDSDYFNSDEYDDDGHLPGCTCHQESGEEEEEESEDENDGEDAYYEEEDEHKNEGDEDNEGDVSDEDETEDDEDKQRESVLALGLQKATAKEESSFVDAPSPGGLDNVGDNMQPAAKSKRMLRTARRSVIGGRINEGGRVVISNGLARMMIPPSAISRHVASQSGSNISGNSSSSISFGSGGGGNPLMASPTSATSSSYAQSSPGGNKTASGSLFNSNVGSLQTSNTASVTNSNSTNKLINGHTTTTSATTSLSQAVLAMTHHRLGSAAAGLGIGKETKIKLKTDEAPPPLSLSAAAAAATTSTAIPSFSTAFSSSTSSTASVGGTAPSTGGFDVPMMIKNSVASFSAASREFGSGMGNLQFNTNYSNMASTPSTNGLHNGGRPLAQAKGAKKKGQLQLSTQQQPLQQKPAVIGGGGGLTGGFNYSFSGNKQSSSNDHNIVLSPVSASWTNGSTFSSMNMATNSMSASALTPSLTPSVPTMTSPSQAATMSLSNMAKSAAASFTGSATPNMGSVSRTGVLTTAPANSQPTGFSLYPNSPYQSSVNGNNSLPPTLPMISKPTVASGTTPALVAANTTTSMTSPAISTSAFTMSSQVSTTPAPTTTNAVSSSVSIANASSHCTPPSNTVALSSNNANGKGRNTNNSVSDAIGTMNASNSATLSPKPTSSKTGDELALLRKEFESIRMTNRQIKASIMEIQTN